MLELLFFIGIIVLLHRSLGTLSRATKKVVAGKKASPQMKQLTEYADRLYHERKYVPAEKVYLNILKLDHKNVGAYNRLGMINAALKRFDDAIECFQIVSQLSPSALSYHNLGLSYFENKNYIKAIASIEKAIMFEPTAARFVGLAKAYQKISNKAKMISSLEKAIDLEPDAKHYLLLAEAHASFGDLAKAGEAYRRLLEIEPTNPKARTFLKSGAKAA